MEHPVDRELKGQGRVLGIALAACVVLPWMSTRTRSWDGDGASETFFFWDLVGKTTAGTILGIWMVVAGVTSILLSGGTIDRRTRAQGYLALGVITVVLLAFGLSQSDVGRSDGGVALLLLHLGGLLAVAFGAVHWASRPGVSLAKTAIGVGIALLAIAYLLPIAKVGRESKAVISLVPEIFDAKEGIFQLIGLYLLMPLAVIGLAIPALVPPGPSGPAARTPVLKIAGLLSMLYLPGLLIIMWFVVMKMSGYDEKVFAVVYIAILIRAMFTWTVYGLDATLLAGAPAPMPMAYPPPPPMGYPPPPPPPAIMGPPCPRCAAASTWVPAYNRWFCARCTVYL